MTSSSHLIGKQLYGGSPDFTKKMAMTALKDAKRDRELHTAADIGGGEGVLADLLSDSFKEVKLLDYNAKSDKPRTNRVTNIQCDLNGIWPLQDGTIDFAFAVEVIEHIENPRHFMREMHRVLKDGGHVFISTPNLHSLTSMLSFLLSGTHRSFRSSCYPAHITALCLIDLERIGKEVSLSIENIYWSGHDRVPLLGGTFPLGGRSFSASIGVLYKKGNS